MSYSPPTARLATMLIVDLSPVFRNFSPTQLPDYINKLDENNHIKSLLNQFTITHIIESGLLIPRDFPEWSDVIWGCLDVMAPGGLSGFEDDYEACHAFELLVSSIIQYTDQVIIERTRANNCRDASYIFEKWATPTSIILQLAETHIPF